MEEGAWEEFPAVESVQHSDFLWHSEIWMRQSELMVSQVISCWQTLWWPLTLPSRCHPCLIGREKWKRKLEVEIATNKDFFSISAEIGLRKFHFPPGMVQLRALFFRQEEMWKANSRQIPRLSVKTTKNQRHRKCTASVLHREWWLVVFINIKLCFFPTHSYYECNAIISSL